MKWLTLLCTFSVVLVFGQKAPNLRKYKTKTEKLEALADYCDELVAKEEYTKLRKVGHQGIALTASKDYYNLSLFTFYVGITFNYGVETDSAAFYLEQSEKYSRKAKDPRRILEALKQLNYVYASSGDASKQDEIIADFEKSIDTTSNLEQKGEINSVIGDYYVNKGEYEKALSRMLNGIKARRKILPKGNATDSTNLGVQLIVVSELYIALYKYDLALDYLAESEKYISDYKVATAHIYKDRVECYTNKKQLKNAKKAYSDLKVLLKDETTIGPWGMLLESDLILARYYNDLGDYKNAFAFTTHAQDLSPKYADDFLKAQIAVTTGLIYLKKKDFTQALKYFKIAEPTTNKDDLELNAELKQALAKTHSGLGNWKEAYRYQSEHAELHEKITREKSKKNMAEMEARYQNEKKQSEIDQLSARDTINKLKINEANKQLYYSLLVILAILVIGILFYLQSRNRKRHNAKLKLLNEELIHANAIKARFFSIINHDLRSPVANLIHFLQLQKDSPDLFDEFSKARLEQKTMTNAENLLRSMEDMLLWSKGQMEQFKPVIEELSVAEIFQNLESHFSSEEGVELYYDKNTSVKLHTDINYLQTILRNLTGNAIKALKKVENPTIRWSVQETEDNITLKITDNGQGASASEFKALYDDTEVIGIKTGLGLHLIRDLAKAIDCEVKVDSELNAGTTISLTIKK